MENRYDAFISYSHRLDSTFARILQRTLEHFGQALPWKRNLRIFRDDTNLAANPDLWGDIKQALDATNHLILLASLDSAESEWVNKELEHFLAHNSPGRLSIVLTLGTTPWTDPDAADAGGLAISQELVALLEARSWQPLVIDLRPFRDYSRWGLRWSTDFLGRAASIAAAVQQVDKDEIYGRHLGAQRRLVVASAGIAVGFAVVGSIAYLQYRSAEHRLDQAVGVANHIHRIVDERLSDVTGAAAARRDLLASSGELLGGLLTDSNTDGKLLYERMVAHTRQGDLDLAENDQSKALAEYTEARRIGQRLQLLDATSREWRSYYALIVNRIGELYTESEDLTTGLRFFEEARSIYASLLDPADRNYDDRAVWTGYSRLLNNLAWVSLDLGQVQEALGSARQQAEIDTSLYQMFSDDPGAGADLLHSTMQLAYAQWVAGQHAEASVRQAAGVALADRLAQAHPDSKRVQLGYADALMRRGQLAGFAGRNPDALSDYAQAVSMLDELVRREPDNVYLLTQLATTLELEIDALEDAGRVADALQKADRIVAIYDDLQAEEPDNDAWTVARAEARIAKAGHLQRQRSFEQADRLYNAAQRLLEDQRSETLEKLFLMAGLHFGIASSRELQGDLTVALSAYETAVKFATKLSERSEQVEHWNALATILAGQADALAASGLNREAMAALRRAGSISAELSDQDPFNFRMIETLVPIEQRIGELLRQQGSLVEATDVYRRTLERIASMPEVYTDELEWRAEKARVLTGLAETHWWNGLSEQAAESIDKAIEIYIDLLDHNPDNLVYRLELTGAMSIDASVSITRNEAQAARTMLEAAMKVLDDARIDDIAVVDSRHTLYSLGGDLAQLDGNPAAMAEAYESALIVARELARRVPDSTRYKRSLMLTLIDVHDARRELQQGDQTFEILQEAELLSAELTTLDPGNATWQSDRSILMETVGDFYLAAQDLERAEMAYRQAVEIDQTLRDQGKDNALADSLADLGDLLRARNRNDEAIELFQQTLRIVEADIDALAEPAFEDYSDLSFLLSRLGSLHSEQGRSLEAIAFFRRALAIDTELANQAPLDASAQDNLGTSLLLASRESVQLGDMHAAVTLLNQAVDRQRQHVAAQPAVSRWRKGLAIYLEDRGELHLKQDDMASAEQDLLEAEKLRRELLNENRSDVRLLSDLSFANARLAKLAAIQGDAETALSRRREVRDVRREVVAHHPDDLDARTEFANASNNLADLDFQSGDYEAAREEHTAAIRQLEFVIERRPNDSTAIRQLAFAHAGLGRLNWMTQAYEESEGAFRKARMIIGRLDVAGSENPTLQYLQSIYDEGIGEAQLAQGQIEQARRAFEGVIERRRALLDAQPTNTEVHRELGRVLKLCGDAYRQLGETALAQARYREAVFIAAGLRLARPRDATLNRDLALTHQALAQLATDAGHHGAALDNLVNALVAYQRTAATDPNSPVYANDTLIILGRLRDSLLAAPKADATRAILAIELGGEEFGRIWPQWEMHYRRLPPYYAFEVLHDANLAFELSSRLAADYPEEPLALAFLAETSLVSSPGEDVTERAINAFAERADTPELRVGAETFRLIHAATNLDSARVQAFSGTLLEALAALEDRPHGWEFSGLKTVIGQQLSELGAQVVDLLTALETEDAEARLANVARVVEELADVIADLEG